MTARRRQVAQKLLALSPKKKKDRKPAKKSKAKAKAKAKADAGKDITKVIADCEPLYQRSLNFNDALKDLCVDLPGTAPGAMITEARFKAAAGERQRAIAENLQPFLAKAFGDRLSCKSALRRVGTESTRSRYVETPGASSFSRTGPVGEGLEEFLDSEFIDALYEAFPDDVIVVRVGGGHVFLNEDARFRAHKDKMKNCSEQAIFIVHIGHAGKWVQETGRAGERKSRVVRHHGCVVSMTTDARVLEHGFEDAEGLGMSMLVKITLKDGANATLIDRIRRHLAVAVNTFLISFDAKTAKPDAATIMPDGGPRVLPWEDFERSCLSEIMSRLGQAGAHASWDGISVEDYEERCEAVSKWMYKYWEDMAPADRDARKVAASEQMTKQWEDMAPADRDARNVAVSKGLINANAKLTRDERASKCKSGLLVPEDAVCLQCGCVMGDGYVYFGNRMHGTRIEVRAKCGGSDGGASCGKVLNVSKFSRRQEMCANVAPDVFALFETELAAALRNYSPRDYRRWTCDDKVAFRLGYVLHGTSWVSIGREVFNLARITTNFYAFCNREMKRINKAQMKVLKGIKMAAMPNAVVRFSADGTINIDKKVLEAHTTPKQREALYG